MTLKKTSVGTWQICSSNQTTPTNTPPKLSSSSPPHTSNRKHVSRNLSFSIDSQSFCSTANSSADSLIDVSTSEQRLLRSMKASITSPKTPSLRSSLRLRQATDPDYKPSMYNQRKCDRAIKKTTTIVKASNSPESSVTIRLPITPPTPPKKSPTSSKTSLVSIKKIISISKRSPGSAVNNTTSPVSRSPKKQALIKSAKKESHLSTFSPNSKSQPTARNSSTTPEGSVSSSRDEDFIGARTRHRHLSASLGQASLAPMLSLISRSSSDDCIPALKLVHRSPDKLRSPLNHKYSTRHKSTGTNN